MLPITYDGCTPVVSGNSVTVMLTLDHISRTKTTLSIVLGSAWILVRMGKLSGMTEQRMLFRMVCRVDPDTSHVGLTDDQQH